MPIVLVANLLLGVFYNLSIWYKLNNLTRYGAMIAIFGATITFTINWLFIPNYGYLASAWAHVACYGSMVIISWLLGQKFFKISYPLKSIGLYVLIAIVIYIGSRYTGRLEFIPRLVVNTLILAGFCIIVVLKERKNIINLNN